jgi:purine-nucleoside phosphorylase
VLGISCITNLAAGIAPRKLTHAEVMETTGRVEEQFCALLATAIPGLPRLLAGQPRRDDDRQ